MTTALKTVYTPTPDTAALAVQISGELLMTTNKEEWYGHAPQTLVLSSLHYVQLPTGLGCDELHICELNGADKEMIADGTFKTRSWTMMEVL